MSGGNEGAKPAGLEGRLNDSTSLYERTDLTASHVAGLIGSTLVRYEAGTVYE